MPTKRRRSAAVCSLVLCSVSDQASALAELRRVIRAGGELRFLEHVRSLTTGKARAQALLDRSGAWPKLVHHEPAPAGRGTRRAARSASNEFSSRAGSHPEIPSPNKEAPR